MPDSAATQEALKVAASRIPGVIPSDTQGGQRRRVSTNGQRMRNNSFDPMQMFNRLWGSIFGGRDYYRVFGWDAVVTPQMIYRRYIRGGIAKRIIEAYPEATWAYPPDMTGVSKSFDKKWKALVTEFDLWNVFYKWDKLSRLGRYGILLLGTDSPNLETPLTKASKIIYLQPYSELSAQITRWETDAGNPRFGLPLEYTIYPDLLEAQTRPPMMTSWGFPHRRSFKVHASRILHVAQGAMEDNVFGIPYLIPCWNHLCDLDKIVGGSAESYWMTANRGLQFDIDKDMDLDEGDEEALAQEIDEYDQQMRRVVRTRGVKIKDLGSRVADPRGPYQVELQLISGTTSIPTRILVGSEAGHLASTQDKSAWSQAIEAYRFLVAYPQFVLAFIDKMQQIGILPGTTADLSPTWPDAYRASPLERAQTVNQLATGAMNLANAMRNVPNMLYIEEARNILGGPSDNSIYLDDDPLGGRKGTLPSPPAASPGKSGDGNPSGGSQTTVGGGNSSSEGAGNGNSNGSGAATAPSGSSVSGSGA